MWAKIWAASAVSFASVVFALCVWAYQLNQEVEHQQALSDALIEEKSEAEDQLMNQRIATKFYYEQLAGCAASVEQLLKMVEKQRLQDPIEL